MIKKIAKGYKNLFSSALKIILLALLCIGIATVFVYPLWKWALASPKSYTLAIFILLGAFFVFLIVNSIRKKGFTAFLKKFLKFAVITGGLAGCIISVLKGSRLISLVILITAVILYGILSFGFKETKSRS